MADHIRALQAFVTCKKIDDTRRYSMGSSTSKEASNNGQSSSSSADANKNQYPLLLCGDLNSDPLSHTTSTGRGYRHNQVLLKI